MAAVIELKRGEEPLKHERHALVLVSERAPREGAPISSMGERRTFYAFNNAADVALVIARAVTWADENIVTNVYVRRHDEIPPATLH